MMKGTTQHIVRVCALLILLLAAAAGALDLYQRHHTHTRGRSAEFPEPIADANVPILGANVALEQYDAAGLNAALDLLADGGFVWIRQTFYWHTIETSPGQFDWVDTDRVLARLSDYPSLRIVAVLDDDPAVPPDDHGAFAAFAAAFAARYGEQIDHYQVWDDPNLGEHWGGGPVSPPGYADLLARTATAIREADPGSRILLAGLSPNTESGPQNLSDLRFLEQLYLAGAAPYFDIVAGKPYGFDTGPDDRRVDEETLNFSRFILLREVMEAHGDAGKALWANNWGWNALPEGWTGQTPIWGLTDEDTQATRTVAALQRAREEWPWCGALILENFQPAAAPDDARWGFALVTQDGIPRPVYQAVRSWTGSLADAAPAGGYPAQNPWAHYAGSWRLGPLGADVAADGDRATFDFDGAAVALTVRRGPYRAHLYVTVDGLPAPALPQGSDGRTYITLYDEAPAVVTIPLAQGLEAGMHTVEVVAERGQGQWMLVDWRVSAAGASDGYTLQLAALALAGCVLVALIVSNMQRLPWCELRRSFMIWPEWTQLGLMCAVTAAVWASAGATWGRLAAGWALSPLHLAFFAASLALAPVLTVLICFRPDLGLALVAATAPFYLQPAGLSSVLSLPELLVLLCVLSACIQRRLWAPDEAGVARLQLTLIDAGVIVLLLAAVISSLGAADRRAALYELRTVFGVPALVYLLLRTSRPDRRMRHRLINAYLIGASAVALIGIVQYVSGTRVAIAEAGLPRMMSVYTSPNNAALYLGRAWPVLAACVVWSKGHRERAAGIIALVAVTLGVALTFSRGALLLGIPAAILVMGAARWRASILGIPAIVLIVAAALIGGLLVLILLLTVPRFASVFDLTQGSTFFRIELWRSSLAMLRDHPVLGVGPGNFLTTYRTRYILPAAWAEPNQSHPHNILLDHWTRLGLLGLAGGALVQVGFWRKVRATSRITQAPELIGLAESMAVLLAHGLVDNTVFAPDLMIALMVMLAVAAAPETTE